MPVYDPLRADHGAELSTSRGDRSRSGLIPSSPDRPRRPSGPAGDPPVYVSTRDYGRLENLAHAQLSARHAVAEFLRAELERAMVRSPQHMPSDAVGMNRCVLFRLDELDRVETRFLVYPQQYHPTGQYLSVLSPLGVALLGLREGSDMRFADLGGATKRVTVEKVVADYEAGHDGDGR